MWPRAILFDLDDTLFDHRRASGIALGAMHAAYAPELPFEAFARKHAEVLEIFHARFLAGALSLEEARVARMKTLFAAFDREIDTGNVVKAAKLYREQHQANRHLVPGAIELLEALRDHSRLGIVTNNSTLEQIEKLRVLNIASFFDAVVISEDVGATKPDRKIFSLALERIGARAEETVFIGDNWTTDICGALNAGMTAVWLDIESETCGSRFPLHHSAVSQATRMRMETSAQPPATADLSGQKRLESLVDIGVSHPHTATVTSLSPTAAVLAAIQTVFKNRTPGAQLHEQLETLAT